MSLAIESFDHGVLPVFVSKRYRKKDVPYGRLRAAEARGIPSCNKAFYFGAQAKHARSCPRYQHDSFGTDLRQVLREEHEDDSTDDHTEEVDEEITSLFCIPCRLWLNGHAQMIDHVMGEKQRKQSARWMQLDLNRATPVERVTPETLQRALFEVTHMFGGVRRHHAANECM